MVTIQWDTKGVFEPDSTQEAAKTIRGAPVCTDCNGTIDDAWWNYCPMCGKHLAAGND